jgi:predicted  nucleic acid-binding Zn-ribbon protein
MHLTQGHSDEQIQVEGELSDKEGAVAILDSASLKEEIKAFKYELTDLKKKKTELSQKNTAAKVEVTEVRKDTGKYSKPIRKSIETILAKDWNIKRPS